MATAGKQLIAETEKGFSNAYVLEPQAEEPEQTIPSAPTYEATKLSTKNYGTVVQDNENTYQNTRTWQSQSNSAPQTNRKPTHDTLTKKHVPPPLPPRQHQEQTQQQQQSLQHVGSRSNIPTINNERSISRRQLCCIFGLFLIIAAIGCGGMGYAVYKGFYDFFSFFSVIVITAFFSIIVMTSCFFK